MPFLSSLHFKPSGWQRNCCKQLNTPCTHRRLVWKFTKVKVECDILGKASKAPSTIIPKVIFIFRLTPHPTIVGFPAIRNPPISSSKEGHRHIVSNKVARGIWHKDANNTDITYRSCRASCTAQKNALPTNVVHIKFPVPPCTYILNQ